MQLIHNFMLSTLNWIQTHRLYWISNILGLAVALGVLILTMAYVYYETHYDQWVPAHEDVYRVGVKYIRPDGTTSNSPRGRIGLQPLIDLEFPEIESSDFLIKGESGIPVKYNGRSYTLSIIQGTSGLFDTLGLNILHGQIVEPGIHENLVAISKSQAELIFGQTSPLGKSINHSLTSSKKNVDSQVVAVFEDIPSNSHLQFDFLYLSPLSTSHPQDDRALSISAYQYIRVVQDADINSIEFRLAQATQNILDSTGGSLFGTQTVESVFLSPVASLHMDNVWGGQFKPPANARKLTLFVLVSTLILGMAVFNFSGFLLSQSSKRLNEMALRKVFGTAPISIAGLLLLESILIVLMCLMLGILFAVALWPTFNLLLDTPFNLIPVLVSGLWQWLSLILAVVATVSVAMPIWSLYKVNPATVFTGMMGNLAQNRLVVTGFVTMQIIIALVVIIMGAGAQMQSKAIESVDFAFKTEKQLVLSLPSPRMLTNSGLFYEIESTEQRRKTASNNITVFLDQLHQHTDIENIAVSTHPPLTKVTFSQNNKHSVDRVFERSDPLINHVTESFFDHFDIKLLAGRKFSLDAGDHLPYMKIEALIEEALASKIRVAADVPHTIPIIIDVNTLRFMGLSKPEDALGKIITKADYEGKLTMGAAGAPRYIIGVAPEIKPRWQFGRAVTPVVYLFDNMKVRSGSAVASIKYTGENRTEFIRQLDAAWEKSFPNTVKAHKWLDFELETLLAPERRRTTLFLWLIFIVLVITILGLQYAVEFSARQMRREMVIRRIFGVAPKDILSQVFWTFLKPVIVANIIGLPVGYLLLEEWLGGYVDRINISPWIFVGASAVSVFLTVFVVARQAWRIATTNPAQELAGAA